MKLYLTTASAKKYLKGGQIVRLEKNYPYIRDLGSRLLRLPIIKRGNFVDKLPQSDDALIAFAQQRKFDLYYGYKICKLNGRDSLLASLLCVDKSGCVVEDKSSRLDNTSCYVGIKVPEADIKSRTYATKFSRADYLPKGYQ
ncbi:hypothetical protein LU11_gp202 [Pseudomonas phage Lu11]|uniref:hypothetical protein n=1 Tax=Pseudomonas phage Lu11 TaxID=1161927 RepID=UPI00025F17F0|nr:hypothetical protein LU11_gp202 [Pseudomonas phage Lu11]AFH14733.1 hypothetical protein Lu11_0196 [Pseudomonas phage Lu11]